MLSEIRIYFEGDKSLKAGFDVFFAEIRERALAARCSVRIVATGGTPERDFGIALRNHPAAWNVLLRDSEGPSQPNRPASLAGSIFWMVEMMESWFHADRDALKAATKDTTKGKYHKTKHVPALLQSIKPALVRKAAPNCERFFASVLDKLG
jgi:hypothetical protein